MKAPLVTRCLLIAGVAALSSALLQPAIAQFSPDLSLRGIAQFYNGLPHQDRALSLLQQQINNNNPELLRADSLAANVWRDNESLEGHIDILTDIDQSDRTGTNPLEMALAVVNPRIGSSVNIEVFYGPSVESPTEAMVTLTESRLLDDSVAGNRYRFDIANQNGQWTITRAGRQFRCQSGRGHQDWSTELCL